MLANKELINRLESKIIHYVLNFDLFGKYLIWVRSILAAGLLGTLIFSSAEHLFVVVNGKISNTIRFNNLENLNLIEILFNYGIELFYIKIILILLLLLIISGYFPKITSILHFWIASSFFSGATFVDGGDQIHQNLSLLLVPICFLDKRHNQWEENKNISSSNKIFGIAAIFLIKLQMSIIYLHAAFGKTSIKEWTDGTAMYYWINNTFFGAPSYLSEFTFIIFSNPIICTFVTHLVIVTEFIFAASIFSNNRSLKKLLFIIAVLFHLNIILIHGIFSFFFSMFAGLIIYFKSFAKNVKVESI